MHDGPIVFYDGVCGLCNRAVSFIIRHDRKGCIRFAPLQSAGGEQARRHVRHAGRDPDSVIFFEKGKYYTESTAAWHIAAYLNGGWKWMQWLRIIPRFLRDAVYRFVSHNRYQWFGKRDHCSLPAPELRRRFLD